MNKKVILIGLFIFSSLQLFASHYQMVPYENVIAREYNRMRGAADRYTSIDKIMNQSLRGKSTEQKNQIIADLRSLKHAIYAAQAQAKYDGSRMWYWFYIWKDNEIAIDTLAQYHNDVSKKLAEFEWQSNSDLFRAGWHASKYAAAFLAGIIAVWASQGYLYHPNHVDENGKPKYLEKEDFHGLVEMVTAPAYAGADVAGITIKKTVASLVYVAEKLVDAAKWTESCMTKTDAQPSVKITPEK